MRAGSRECRAKQTWVSETEGGKEGGERRMENERKRQKIKDTNKMGKYKPRVTWERAEKAERGGEAD